MTEGGVEQVMDREFLNAKLVPPEHAPAPAGGGYQKAKMGSTGSGGLEEIASAVGVRFEIAASAFGLLAMTWRASAWRLVFFGGEVVVFYLKTDLVAGLLLGQRH
jgi:hypothetical protein